MKTLNYLPRLVRLHLWLMLCIFGSALAAQAATIYWIGNGNSSATREWNRTVVWGTSASGPSTTINNTSPGDDLVFGVSSPLQALLNTRPTIGNWYAHSMTFNENGWLVPANTGTDKITLGSGGITYNSVNQPGVNSGGTTNAATQFRCLIDLSANCTIYNGDLTNQLTIRQDASSLSLGNPICLDNKGFTLTFDGPGTNVFNTPTSGSHAGGAITGSGGVIKNGAGSTQFSATNAYTGLTAVNAGQLIVKTWCKGGGAYTVADGANLQVTVGSAGTTLNISNLNVTSTTTNSLTLALSSLGNPTVPVVYATNLTLNGTIYLTITGSGLAEGVIPLIQYNGSIAGGGTMVTNSLPSGVGGYLTNNTTAHQIQLVVTSVPSLNWVGKVGPTLAGNWDQLTTLNWFDTSSSLPAVYANGLPVLFDDTAFTNIVTLVTNVSPYKITVNNSALTYTFTNDGVSGFQVLPSAGLIKTGPGKLVLGASNNYTSFTYIQQGTVQVGANNAIGRGIGNSGAALTNNGTLDLNGYTENIGILAGSGVITNSSASPAILQSQAGATDGGTFSGRIDEGSGGPITFNKSGGILTMSGNNNYSGGTVFVIGGAQATRWIILGGNNVLGTGPITFGQTSTLTSDANPRSVNNSIFLQSSSSFGSAGAGLLTCSGPVTLQSGVDSTFTYPSDVVFSGPLTSDPFYKGGFQIKDGAHNSMVFAFLFLN
ncbi:MAG: autotransporter-associated beta strand repeat-containing protein [Verrucomicrobiota bacterium]